MGCHRPPLSKKKLILNMHKTLQVGKADITSDSSTPRANMITADYLLIRTPWKPVDVLYIFFLTRQLGTWRPYINMVQIRDTSTFTSNGVIKKLKYIDQHFVAFEARDLILSFSKNSAIMIFLKI